MRDDYVKPAMESMVRQKEDSIKTVLDERVPGWTILDIVRRCTFIHIAGNPSEFLYLDGKPIMEFFPIETEMDIEGNKYVMRVTQKLRRLDLQEGDDAATR